MAHGEFTHIEIPYDDGSRARDFYGGVFGWSFREMDGMPGYWTFPSGPGDLGGGLGLRGTSAPLIIRTMVEVDDLDVALENVVAHGGAVLLARQDLGFGWYAVIHDSEGNELGVYQPKRRA